MLINVGENKRKREDDDGNFYQSKRRLMKGSVVEAVLEKEENKTGTIRDDADGVPRLPSSPCEFSDRDSASLQESHDERIAKVRTTLENLKFLDPDTQSPDNSPSTMHAEAHDDYIQEWESRYRGKRCHSESSIELPPHANAFTGALPGDSGRMSAPPNLDATWSLTSHLAGCPSPGCNFKPGIESEPGVDAAKPKENTKALVDAVVLAIAEAGVLGEAQVDEPESASTTTDTASGLTFRAVDSPAGCFDNTTQAKLSYYSREVTAEGLAGGVRALQRTMMHRLESIEYALKPHCSGAGWGR
ncbi:hypothetical protein ACHAQJ_006382 [Trichoderma viride]